MEKLKEKVAVMLRESAGRPLKMKEIERRLDISEDGRQKLHEAVRELVKSGDVVETRGNRFGAIEHMNLVAGSFIGHPDGFGFVQLPPRPGQADLPDIYVSGRDVDGAMHGDKVVVRVSGGGRPSQDSKTKKSGRPQKARKSRGEIIRVLERAHTSLIGYFDRGKNFAFVVPIDERITQHIYVDFADSLDAEPGQIVTAEITEYPSRHRNPEGKITEILGTRGDRGLDTELLIRKHGLSVDFPPSAIKAADKLKRKIPRREIKRRVDLRDLPMATIDGADAKDYDDAVSIEVNERGNYMLGVHIADVSYYVTPGSALDDEAYSRATSTYLEDRVLPMLPERLSNDLCSLREKEDRLAMTAMMEVDPKGKLQGCDIFESVIRVDHRMTYDDVLAIIEGDKELSDKYADFVDNFHMMNKLARKLRSNRMAHGSLDFSFPEARAIFDNEGEVVDIVLRRQTLAHELIEEFMLMANQAVASHVTDKGAPMLYRIHETPADDRIEKFREFVASIGYQLGEKGAGTPKGLQKVSRQAKGKPEENLINYLMLRALKMARYSPENLGHFGLACECYTHFTSPIRRYPDLVVHRIMKALASGGVKLVTEEYSESIERIAEHCSGRERKSIEAERESLETKQLFFMSDKVGGEFVGRITGVHSYGLFIELVDYLVEGLIHISSLDDDYYIYMEEKHCLLGEHAGKSYRLGDELKVRVVKIDLDRKRMDFVVADDKQPAKPGAKQPAKRSGKPPTKSGGKAPAKRRRGRRRR